MFRQVQVDDQWPIVGKRPYLNFPLEYVDNDRGLSFLLHSPSCHQVRTRTVLQCTIVLATVRYDVRDSGSLQVSNRKRLRPPSTSRRSLTLLLC